MYKVFIVKIIDEDKFVEFYNNLVQEKVLLVLKYIKGNSLTLPLYIKEDLLNIINWINVKNQHYELIDYIYESYKPILSLKAKDSCVLNFIISEKYKKEQELKKKEEKLDNDVTQWYNNLTFEQQELVNSLNKKNKKYLDAFHEKYKDTLSNKII